MPDVVWFYLYELLPDVTAWGAAVIGVALLVMAVIMILRVIKAS